ncbi:hypothetical protein C1645_782872 [Glomus cerebriforme]|uniref:Uncharacterized protein n=2 Tax=Glomus cerebriforme TaxID=658196 RepID=A0A397SQB5_9GLOM|nr:hypothetical protein C1645_782872 [Glomus cerebriforme]
MKITRIFILFFLFVIATIATSYVPNDPTTWTPNELKEWLAEHRVTYKGIPEKQELVDLVKANWDDVKGRANTTTEAVESFVSKYINAVKDVYYNTEEQEKYDEFVQEVADQIESIRQATGLTEEQTQSTINEVVKRLKGTKVEGSKSLINALTDVQKSYTTAQAKRDVIIQETTNRIQDDLQKSGIVTPETLNWFKDEIDKMSEAGAFAKARTETQVSLILQGVQEQLTKRKLFTTEQINATYEKLNSITITGILDRLRHRLYTVNTAIGQKLSDGKTLTVEQLQQIRSTINNYLTAVKDYYNSATGSVKQSVLETKRSQEERINIIIEAVRSSINDARNKGNQKISSILQSVEENVSSTQQLTAEQTKILSETIQEKLGDLKDARDLSEDKVNSFADALRTRMAAVRDYAADTYDTASQKVEEGYNIAYNKVSSGAESVGEGYETVKEHLSPHREKDEL